MNPLIITVAITGSVPRKADTPAVPVTPAEQIESTRESFEAGATIVHIHVRNPDESSGSDPARFQEVQEGVRERCPGMIVQFSTGGRGRTPEERAGSLPLRPDMASLTCGSVNFPDFVFENPPSLVETMARQMLENGIKPEIEIFDLSMLYAAFRLRDRGLLASPLHVQFVLGIALPAKRHLLEFLLGELRRDAPDATWAAAGIGRHQLEVNRWTLELGGHARTGLEDNIRFDKDRLAASNAELVARVASLANASGRSVADAATARSLLHLPAAV